MGNVGDPVAEEKTLGWTHRGQNTSEDQSSSSSLLWTTAKEILRNQITKLWDSQTVRIREVFSVKDEFHHTVSFDG